MADNQTPGNNPVKPVVTPPAQGSPNISMGQAKQIVDEFMAKKKAAEADLEKLTAKPTESLADLVEDFEEKQNDFQSMYKAGGTFKQKLESIAGSFRGGGGKEMQPERPASKPKPVESAVEIPTEVEVEKKPELTGYVEKIQKEIQLAKPIVDDYTQQILLKPSSNQNPSVKLPMTEDEIEKGLHEQLWESVRWLAEWCVRQVKMLGDKAVLKKTE